MAIFEPTLALASDEQILTAIRAQQEIQMRHPPNSPAWQSASNALAPLFHEMKLRYPAGKLGPAV